MKIKTKRGASRFRNQRTVKAENLFFQLMTDQDAFAVMKDMCTKLLDSVDWKSSSDHDIIDYINSKTNTTDDKLKDACDSVLLSVATQLQVPLSLLTGNSPQTNA